MADSTRKLLLLIKQMGSRSNLDLGANNIHLKRASGCEKRISAGNKAVKSLCGEESMRGRGRKRTTTQSCVKGQRVFVLIANSGQTVKRSAALHQWNVRGTVRGTNGSMHEDWRVSFTRLRTAPAGFCGSRRTCLPGQKKKTSETQ